MKQYVKSEVVQKLSAVVAVFTLATMSLTGCGRGSNKNVKIDGVDGPHVNFVDGKLTLSAVIKNLSIDFGTRLQIPKMPNSYLEVGPDFASNGYLLSVGLDSADIKALAGANMLDPTTLPGGRPLPGVINGQLPGIAVEVPKLDDMTFYVGAAVFGVFVPVKLPNLPIANALTYRFYDGSGAQVGNISLVGRDASGKNSGFLLLVSLQGKVGRLIAMPTH